jgi:5-methylcytosine-specific restriction endonuclease McrA
MLTKQQKSTHPFYGLPQWKALRKQALIRDNHQCTVCKADVSGWKQSRVDHIQQRKTHPHLALTLSNLRTLCAACDNKRHAEKGNPRPGYDASGVPLDPQHHWADTKTGTPPNSEADPHPNWLKPSLVPIHLVCGPPASGKSTFVREHAGPGDLVLDLDDIIAEIAGRPVWDNSERLQHWLSAALAERNRKLDRLSTPPEPCSQAWLIVSEPYATWRSWWRKTLGPGNTYVLLTPLHICRQRIATDRERAIAAEKRSGVAWAWWKRYIPSVEDLAVR